jgi:hypothetical protein
MAGNRSRKGFFTEFPGQKTGQSNKKSKILGQGWN